MANSEEFKGTVGATNEELQKGLENTIDHRGASFFISAYFERLQAGQQSAIYMAFMIILFLFWFLSIILGIMENFIKCITKPLRWCYKKMKKCLCKEKKYIKSKDIYKEYNVESLKIMYQKAQDDLDDFQRYMSQSQKGNSIEFSEHRFEEEVNFEATTIISMHQTRIRQIELMIDEHLYHLHGA